MGFGQTAVSSPVTASWTLKHQGSATCTYDRGLVLNFDDYIDFWIEKLLYKNYKVLRIRCFDSLSIITQGYFE